MRNKEQKGGLSMQGIADPSAVGMISTKLFSGRNVRLHAQRGYFIIHGRQAHKDVTADISLLNNQPSITAAGRNATVSRAMSR